MKKRLLFGMITFVLFTMVSLFSGYASPNKIIINGIQGVSGQVYIAIYENPDGGNDYGTGNGIISKNSVEIQLNGVENISSSKSYYVSFWRANQMNGPPGFQTVGKINILDGTTSLEWKQFVKYPYQMGKLNKSITITGIQGVSGQVYIALYEDYYGGHIYNGYGNGSISKNSVTIQLNGVKDFQGSGSYYIAFWKGNKMNGPPEFQTTEKIVVSNDKTTLDWNQFSIPQF